MTLRTPTDLNKAIDQYFALEEDIKKALGWRDSWKVLPLCDCRSLHWMLVGGDKETGRDSTVVTSSDPFTAESVKAGKVISGCAVYTQRDHERWIYRAHGVVLVPVNTHTDGNIFLYLLDAAKETVNEAFEASYDKCWGSGSFDDDEETA